MSTTTHPSPARPEPGHEPAHGSETPALPDDAVEVGRVLGAWGVKGGIKVKPFSTDPQALFGSRHWFVKPAELKPGHQVPAVLHVLQAREQNDAVVATVQEVTDRDAAQALAGARLFIARANFPAPASGEFYWVDLIGLAVQNREGLALGRVIGLIETGPHCVLRIEPTDPQADQVLVPFVDAYVDRVDLPGRCIHVDWQPDY